MLLLCTELYEFPCGWRLVSPCQAALLLWVRGRESENKHRRRRRKRRRRRSCMVGSPHFTAQREVRNVGLDFQKPSLPPPKAFKRLSVSPIQWQAGRHDHENLFCWTASGDLPEICLRYSPSMHSLAAGKTHYCIWQGYIVKTSVQSNRMTSLMMCLKHLNSVRSNFLYNSCFYSRKKALNYVSADDSSCLHKDSWHTKAKHLMEKDSLINHNHNLFFKCGLCLSKCQLAALIESASHLFDIWVFKAIMKHTWEESECSFCAYKNRFTSPPPSPS